MRIVQSILSATVVAFSAVVGLQAAYAADVKEDYVRAPMPPGIQVVVSEIEGPVFADTQGRTIYMWRKRGLRNGSAGEDLGKPTCGDEVVRESSGMQSPYPGGFILPEIETRPSCTQVWPPVYAADGAKPVGKWTVVKRLDGRMQLAYEGHPLYTSVLDKMPGDVYGGTGLPGASKAVRTPVGPESNVPGQFSVHTTMAGRLVTLRDGASIYTWNGDGRNKSNCRDVCLNEWDPILAPSTANSVGEWTTFERALGVRQWAFRGRPVYQHPTDPKDGSRNGEDTPGWQNVYAQVSPAPPKGLGLKRTVIGDVLGDSQGMTIYKYNCGDDAVDQLTCDTPESPQAYRFAVCGGGDPDLCVKTFPYVLAPEGAKTGNRVWGTMYIDPKTGKRATAKAPSVLHVWTFRDRPIYTFAGHRGYGDSKPTDINAHSWGEGEGQHNGFLALVYRDITQSRDGMIGRNNGR